MSSLLLYQSHIRFSFDELRSGFTPLAVTEYESAAWQFCRDWLTGKETFQLQTSGSTGTPKPIAVSRQQMEASAAMTGRVLQLRMGDKSLVNLNVQYIAGLMMLVRGLELELELTIVEPSANPLENFPVNTRFDFQSYVPLQLQTILEKTPEKVSILNAAKAILLGGAPVPAALEEKLQAIAAPVYQTYGMTETVSHVALRRLNGSERQGFYSALDTISFEMDEQHCLIIHAPELNDNPVVTNDVVELLSPASFRWLGRADHVINSGGVKVQAEKAERAVEAAFAEWKVTRRFFVTGLPHSKLGEAVALIVEGEPLSAELQNSIFQNLKTSLSRYEIPKQICYITQFIETPTAKIDKKKTLLGIR